jgi:hypothetical protein
MGKRTELQPPSRPHEVLICGMRPSGHWHRLHRPARPGSGSATTTGMVPKLIVIMLVRRVSFRCCLRLPALLREDDFLAIFIGSTGTTHWHSSSLRSLSPSPSSADADAGGVPWKVTARVILDVISDTGLLENCSSQVSWAQQDHVPYRPRIVRFWILCTSSMATPSPARKFDDENVAVLILVLFPHVHFFIASG